MKKVSPVSRKPVELRPVMPSAAVRAAYLSKIDALLLELHRSVLYHVKAAYRANSPEIMAMDASPARELRAVMRKLGRRWQAKFDALAPKLAEYFAQAAGDRVDAELKRMLRQAGISVRFDKSRVQNDVMQATIGENVALIKSVGAQHLAAIEGTVMRSVQEGRDLATLSKALQEQYGVVKRRADLIARSQNNMATAALTRTRQQELGITKARWQHSAGGKTPRPEHVAFSGKTYDVSKGAFLEGVWTWPGREINCRCVSIPILPGFD